MSSSAFPKLRGPDGQASRVQDNVAKQLQPISSALAATPIMGAAPSAWVGLAPMADFANIAGFAPLSYRLDCLKQLWLIGSVITAAGVLASTQVCALPIGFRPRYLMRFVVRGDAATFQSVTISPTGAVVAELAIGAGGSLDLGGISFLAEV